MADRAGRDDRDPEAEPRVAQAGAGRPQEARLEAEQVEALQEAPLESGRNAGGNENRNEIPDMMISYESLAVRLAA